MTTEPPVADRILARLHAEALAEDEARAAARRGDPMARPLSAEAAKQVVEGAALTKAPSWAEDNHWHVVAGGQVLVVIAPAYSGTRRTGWRYWLHDLGPSGSRTTHPTLDQAAAVGLGAWVRWVTSRPT